MLSLIITMVIVAVSCMIIWGTILLYYNNVDKKLQIKHPEPKSINKIRLQLNNEESGYRDSKESWVEFIKVNDDVMVLFCINGKQHCLPQKKLNEFFLRVFDQ